MHAGSAPPGLRSTGSCPHRCATRHTHFSCAKELIARRHGMARFKELDVVRIAVLLNTNRPYQGTEGVSRPPQVGDSGTVVSIYDETGCCVESVAPDGHTVWLADFLA